MKEFINKVVNADCFDIIPKIPNKSIDLLLTDPPYGVIGRTQKWDNVKIDTFTKKWWKMLKPKMKENSSAYIFFGQKYIPLGFKIFKPHRMLIWHHPNLCFDANTPVFTTTSGIKKIIDIKKGDKVLSRDGIANVLGKIKKTAYEFTEVYTTCLPEPIKCDSNHLFWAIPNKTYGRLWHARARNDNRIDNAFKWTEAKHLTKQSLLMFKIDDTENDLNINKEMAWLFGYYCADGNISRSKYFSVRKNKITIKNKGLRFLESTKYPDRISYVASLLKKISKNKVVVDIKKDKAMAEIRTYDSELADYFEHHCGGPKNKKLLPELLFMKKSLQKEFLKGFIDGDGCVLKKYYKDKDVVFITQSMAHSPLIYDLLFILQRLRIQYCCHSYKQRRSKHNGCSISIYNFDINNFEQKGIKRRTFWYRNNTCIVRVKKIKKIVKKKILYDLTTSDNTFNVAGIIVHNCKPTTKMFLWSYDPIFYVKFGKPTFQPSFVGSENVDVFKYPKPQSNWENNMRWHPASKPLELIKIFVKISSKENDIVFDPFLGGGTTAVAAQHLKRRFIGIEKELEYYKISKRRLAQKILI